MMKRLLTYLLLISVFFSACKKENEVIEKSATRKEQKLDNQQYGTDARHVMDVWLPANRTDKTPVAILIHGGSWVSGDKEDLQELQLFLLQQNVASASINYRYVSDEVNGNDLMTDVGNALAYVQKHADDWHIKKSGYVMGGVSAGAHMSLLYGYKYDKGKSIAALISASGPVDFDKTFLSAATLLGQGSLIKNFSGVEYAFGAPVPEEIKALSPINFIADIPTLIVHGDEDFLVPYSQAVKLNEALEKKNIAHQFVTIQGEGHNLGIEKSENKTNVFSSITAWIKQYGK